jgi:hypothetical protein
MGLVAIEDDESGFDILMAYFHTSGESCGNLLLSSLESSQSSTSVSARIAQIGPIRRIRRIRGKDYDKKIIPEELQFDIEDSQYLKVNGDSLSSEHS